MDDRELLKTVMAIVGEENSGMTALSFPVETK